MSKTGIEWTEYTWNPVTGCTEVSDGCRFCYAKIMARRLKAMGLHKYRNEFEVTQHPGAIKEPYKWKSGKVFVVSMGDLFHQNVTSYFIRKVFDVMNDNPQLTFQVLTKRPERALNMDMQELIEFTPNIWMGTSAEDKKTFDERISFLIKIRSTIRYVSCEPLLGPIEFSDVTRRSDAVSQLGKKALSGIHWIIVGGESGRRPRPMEPAWVRSIRDQCQAADVAFFFKQWGGTNKKLAGSLLDGKEYKEYPIIK